MSFCICSNAYKPTNTYCQLLPPPYDNLEQDFIPTENFITSVKPKNFIWGLDANSKHSIWYSPSTDTRGRILVDFLSLHGLLTAQTKRKALPTPGLQGKVGLISQLQQ